MTSDPNRRTRFLKEMGLDPVWVHQTSEPAAVPDTLVANAPASAFDSDFEQAVEPLPVAREESPVLHMIPTASSAESVAEMDWETLRTTVAGCVKCGLCKTRTKTVFGTGSTKAKWLFVGEGPGRNEDLQGEPFIGPAGRLLDNMLLAMGLKRGVTAYIANVVKCRPTDASGRDRPPTPEEIDACLPYLKRQIELINPDIITALGKSAAISLTGSDPETSVGQLRGKAHIYDGRPLVVTYHPAYLLRKLEHKALAWRDLCLAMTIHAEQSNER